MARRWVIGAIFLLFMLPAFACGSTIGTATKNSGSNPTSTTVKSAGNAIQATSTTAGPASNGVQSTTTKASSSQNGNKGITFGKPVVFSAGGVNIVGVLVTNTTDQVKSFTAKATYKTGDQITATAAGAVNDLLPGQTRAASLISQTPIPANFDSVRVEVDTMVREAKSTAASDAASKLTFGTPTTTSTGGLSMVNVEVTNGDSKIHSFTIQVAFVQDGELVGLATGAVNDIEPGQTKTATLITQGKTDGEAKVAIETVVK